MRAPIRAAVLAAQLTAATGNTARTAKDGSVTRIEVDVPSQLSGPARQHILTALATADRYGHSHTAAGSVVWAEVVGPSQ